MNKWLIPAVTASLFLAGCNTVPRGSIPVVDGGSPISSGQVAAPGGYPSATPQVQALPEESGVVVMVPGGVSSTPIQSFPATNAPLDTGVSTQPWSASPPAVSGGYVAPAPSGIPSGGLAMDEQLDGPVLALLTTAQQQQGGGDLNGAASSLERAQRIAPREPQVLYRLAEVRMAQGDTAQASDNCAS